MNSPVQQTSPVGKIIEVEQYFYPKIFPVEKFTFVQASQPSLVKENSKLVVLKTHTMVCYNVYIAPEICLCALFTRVLCKTINDLSKADRMHDTNAKRIEDDVLNHKCVFGYVVLNLNNLEKFWLSAYEVDCLIRYCRNIT